MRDLDLQNNVQERLINQDRNMEHLKRENRDQAMNIASLARKNCALFVCVIVLVCLVFAFAVKEIFEWLRIELPP